MLGPELPGPEPELAASGPPLVVGQQGVVVVVARERALDEAEHHDQVEVEAERRPERAGDHAVAEPAVAPEVGVELQLDGAAHRALGGVRRHGVERRESLEDGVDPLRGPLLVDRPRPPGSRRAQEALEER